MLRPTPWLERNFVRAFFSDDSVFDMVLFKHCGGQANTARITNSGNLKNGGAHVVITVITLWPPHGKRGRAGDLCFGKILEEAKQPFVLK
jgi:hypothetical protein